MGLIKVQARRPYKDDRWSIRVRGAAKRYGSNILFEGLDLDLEPGKKILLRGLNGSGKTQLLQALCGLVSLDSGRITYSLNNGPEEIKQEPHGLDQYLRYVPATLLQLSQFVVCDFVSLVSRDLAPFGLGSRDRASKRAFGERRDFLEEKVGRALSPELLIGQLSVGQQKRLLLAATLSSKVLPKALLVDEPLAALDEEGSEQILALLREVSVAGLALVVAEHHPKIESIGFDETLELPFRLRKTIRSSQGPILLSEEASKSSHEEAQVLALQGVEAGYRGAEVQCERLTLRRGEVVILEGPNGSGKTGFLKALAGIHATQLRGRMSFRNVDVADLTKNLRRGEVRYLSQDRRSFPDLTVKETLAAAALNTLGATAYWPEDILKKVGPRKLVRHLSSGNRALLALAQTLASQPALALLDEPTANLDAQNRKVLMELIQFARCEWGTAFLIAEHNSFKLPGARYYCLKPAEDQRMELIAVA